MTITTTGAEISPQSVTDTWDWGFGTATSPQVFSDGDAAKHTVYEMAPHTIGPPLPHIPSEVLLTLTIDLLLTWSMPLPPGLPMLIRTHTL